MLNLMAEHLPIKRIPRQLSLNQPAHTQNNAIASLKQDTVSFNANKNDPVYQNIRPALIAAAIDMDLIALLKEKIDQIPDHNKEKVLHKIEEIEWDSQPPNRTDPRKLLTFSVATLIKTENNCKEAMEMLFELDDDSHRYISEKEVMTINKNLARLESLKKDLSQGDPVVQEFFACSQINKNISNFLANKAISLQGDHKDRFNRYAKEFLKSSEGPNSDYNKDLLLFALDVNAVTMEKFEGLKRDSELNDQDRKLIDSFINRLKQADNRLKSSYKSVINTDGMEDFFKTPSNKGVFGTLGSMVSKLIMEPEEEELRKLLEL